MNQKAKKAKNNKNKDKNNKKNINEESDDDEAVFNAAVTQPVEEAEEEEEEPLNANQPLNVVDKDNNDIIKRDSSAISEKEVKAKKSKKKVPLAWAPVAVTEAAEEDGRHINTTVVDSMKALNISSSCAPSLTEEEREARLRSTLFGDEIVPEYNNMSMGGGSKVGDDDVTKSKKGKLSNKDKRRLAKEEEARERQMEYDKAAMIASAAGAQFAVSQSAIDENDPQWQNALDITIPNFSISAHNKELLVNAELSIVHGRRYGLVAPNGAGKSTLLKMIAAKELRVPPRVDFLYVEQEVIADDTSAVDSVLKADK